MLLMYQAILLRNIRISWHFLQSNIHISSWAIHATVFWFTTTEVVCRSYPRKKTPIESWCFMLPQQSDRKSHRGSQPLIVAKFPPQEIMKTENMKKRRKWTPLPFLLNYIRTSTVTVAVSRKHRVPVHINGKNRAITRRLKFADETWWNGRW